MATARRVSHSVENACENHRITELQKLEGISRDHQVQPPSITSSYDLKCFLSYERLKGMPSIPSKDNKVKGLT